MCWKQKHTQTCSQNTSLHERPFWRISIATMSMKLMRTLENGARLARNFLQTPTNLIKLLLPAMKNDFSITLYSHSDTYFWGLNPHCQPIWLYHVRSKTILSVQKPSYVNSRKFLCIFAYPVMQCALWRLCCGCALGESHCALGESHCGLGDTTLFWEDAILF